MIPFNSLLWMALTLSKKTPAGAVTLRGGRRAPGWFLEQDWMLQAALRPTTRTELSATAWRLTRAHKVCPHADLGNKECCWRRSAAVQVIVWVPILCHVPELWSRESRLRANRALQMRRQAEQQRAAAPHRAGSGRTQVSWRLLPWARGETLQREE